MVPDVATPYSFVHLLLLLSTFFFIFFSFSYSLTLFTSGSTIFACVLGVEGGGEEDIRQAKVQDHEDC